MVIKGMDEGMNYLTTLIELAAFMVSIFVTSWRVTLMQVKIFVHTSLNCYTWLMLKSQILHCWYVLCEQLQQFKL